MSTLVFFAIVMFGIRLFLLQRLWRLPIKNGEGYFLAQPVKPGFYREAGAALLRRWRVSLLVMLLLDSPLTVWLIVTARELPLVMAQIFACVVTVIVYNLMAAIFRCERRLLPVLKKTGIPPRFSFP